MVTCNCGKKIENVPSWLESAQVTFICNNCPNRTLQSIADVKLEEPKTAAADPIDEEILKEEDEAEED